MKHTQDEDVTADDLRELLGNSEPIVQLLEIINTAYTGNSRSVVDVIHDMENLALRFRCHQHLQVLRRYGVDAIWFGWRATHKLLPPKAVFGEYPQRIPQGFILRCIEVGTAIAARQVLPQQQ